MLRIINVQHCRIAKSYSNSVSVEILRMRYILYTKSNAFLSINLCPEAAQSDLIKIDSIYKRKTEQQNKMFRIIDVQHCWTVKSCSDSVSVEILRMRRIDLDQDRDSVGGVAFAAASSRHAHSTKFFGKPFCDGSPETLFILGVLPFCRLWATLWSRDQFRAFAWLLRHRHHSLHDACIRIRPYSNFYLLFH